MVFYTMSVGNTLALEKNHGPSLDVFFVDSGGKKTYMKYLLIDSKETEDKHPGKFCYGQGGYYSRYYWDKESVIISKQEIKKIDNVLIDQDDNFFAIFNIVKDNINGSPSNKIVVEKYKSSVIVDEKVKVCRLENELYVMNYI